VPFSAIDRAEISLAIDRSHAQQPCQARQWRTAAARGMSQTAQRTFRGTLIG
jgi:hypothetical protein